MAKIVRKVAKVFGSTAGGVEIAEFGSLFAGTPVFTNDPAVIQSLGNWLAGWFQAVEGVNSPAIEDMNAYCYVMAYQVAYIMQTGVPEWETNTIYFIGSIAQDGTGRLFRSLTDNNTGNALTDTTNWALLIGAVLAKNFAQSPYSPSASSNARNIDVDVTNGIFQMNLPDPAVVGSGWSISVKDYLGLFSPSGFYAFFAPHGAELIEGLNANYNMFTPWGLWTIYTDGTNWFIK